MRTRTETRVLTEFMTPQNDIRAFVPVALARRLASAPAAPPEPAMRELHAAVLFADIAGFTQLGEQLAALGHRGAEELSVALAAYFGKLVSIVTAHGGEIVRFAGDAPIVLWPAVDGLAEAARRAAQCALDLQSQLHGYTTAQGRSLSLRIGLSAGAVTEAILGGSEHRWEHVVFGRPITEAGTTQGAAASGEVVAAPSAWSLLESSCDGVAARSGVRIAKVRDTLPPRPLAAPELPAEASAQLNAFISRALTARIDTGQGEWLAELRRVSALFVSLQGLAESGPSDLDRVQAVTKVLQDAVYQFDGSVNQLLVDDKGMVLLAAWGVPTRTHEDDPARAVLAGRQIQAGLRALGVNASAGVATGRVFCGFRGGPGRRDYALMGATVNFAARLMQLAGNDVLCDEATAGAASGRFAFETLPPRAIKGKSEPITTYRLLDSSVRTAARQQSAIFGREREQRVLSAALDELRADTGVAVVLEGEAGIGKSCLTRAFEQKSRQRGFRVLQGAGDSFERATPYFAWRTVIADIFGVLDAVEPERRRAAVNAWLHQHPAWEPTVALLNPLLGLDLPESELTSSMSPEARARSTNELLLALLLQSARAAPTVVILDDAHWLDSASWELLRLLVIDRQPLGLLVAMRPPSEPKPTGYAHLVSAAGDRHLQLKPLDGDGALQIVCQRLGATRLAEPIAAFINERAEGHPFYSEEIALALRESDWLTVENGEARLSPGAPAITALGLPSTLEGIIASRIDRLTPAQQLTLKTASVIGRTFTHRVLRDVHPIEAERPLLKGQLNALTNAELTLLDTSAIDQDGYFFKHIVTQETTYNLLLFAQRRQLHQTIAEWYERTHAADLAPYRGLLAFHWVRAEVVEKAIDALEAAGVQALRSYANHEAASFFSQALSLAEKVEVPELRRARWERWLTEAQHKTGRLQEAMTHGRHVAALMGHAIPETPLGRFAKLSRGMFEQWLLRRFPKWLVKREELGSERLLEAAFAHSYVSTMSFWANDVLTMIYGTVVGTNLLERHGPCPLLVRGYGGMCLVMGAIPLHCLAEAYGRRALQAGEELGDPDSIAYAHLFYGIYLSGAGRLEESSEHCGLALATYERLGDGRFLEDTSSALALSWYYLGRWQEMIALVERTKQSARRRGDSQNATMMAMFQAVIRSRMGDYAGALAAFHQIKLEPGDQLNRTSMTAESAWACVQLERFDEARAAVDEAALLVGKQRPSSMSMLESRIAVANTYRVLWLRAVQQKHPDAAKLRRAAQQACGWVEDFARVFPLAEPAVHLCRGALELGLGRAKKARARWEKALAAASRMKAAPFMAAAHESLAQTSAGEEQELHRQAAQSIRAALMSASPTAIAA